MKKPFLVLVALLLLAVLLSLSTVAHAGMVYRYKLIAGQDTQVGVVEVWNTEDTLYILYSVWSSSYCLQTTHVHVADTVLDVPHNKAGPIPGQFDYQTQHGCTAQALYEIPLSAGGWTIGDRVVIVAHASVGRPGDPYWTETAWGVQCGDFATWSYPGTKWAAYMEYPIHYP